MNILVTGGAGYIGSHACLALSENGFTPVVFDNLSRGHRHNVRWGPLVEGDVRNTALLAATMRDYSIRAAIHFAAVAYVGESSLRPDLYYENNVGGGLSLLKAVQLAGVEALVFSSSCTVYGLPKTDLIDESHSLAPISPYGWSKLTAERAIVDYAAAFGFRAVSLRYFNAAGANVEQRLGEEHDPEPHLIPLALLATRVAGAPLRVFGNDYATDDGTCIRDYVHVTDLAQAHVAAVQRLLAGDVLEPAYNLGTGVGASVTDVIRAVQQATGRPVRCIVSERRPGDPHKLVAGITAARRDLHWHPTSSTLEHIVDTAWRWMTATGVIE